MQLPEGEQMAAEPQGEPVCFPNIPQSWAFGIGQELEKSVTSDGGRKKELLQQSMATPAMTTTQPGGQKQKVKKEKKDNKVAWWADPVTWPRVTSALTGNIRAYITGFIKDGDGKRKLIVGLSKNEHPNFLKIIQKIFSAMQKKAMSKNDALAMKQTLMNKD